MPKGLRVRVSHGAPHICPGHEMVYIEDLKSSDFGHAGSSPAPGTRCEISSVVEQGPYKAKVGSSTLSSRTKLGRLAEPTSKTVDSTAK